MDTPQFDSTPKTTSIDELLAAHRPKRLTLTAVALLLAAIWNLLFWGSNAGISFFMYIAVFAVAFTGLMWRFGHATRKRALWLLIPILVLAFNVARFETPFVESGIPVITVVLLIIYCSWLTLRIPEGARFNLLGVRMFQNIFLPFTTTGMVFKDLKQDTLLGDRADRKTLLHNVLWGLAIAAPIFLIFLGLFMSADPVFKQAVLSIIEKLHIDWETFWRLIIIAFWTLILSSFFYFYSSRAHEMHDTNHDPHDYSTPILNTVFIVLNILFLGFVYIQVRYLFLGSDALALRDLTFAQYAREGFFQLVIAVALVALMGMILYGTLTRTASLLLRSMAMVFLALSVVIAFSALHRLGMYQEVFGLTLSRFYASALVILFAAELTMTIVLIAMRLRFGQAFAIHTAMILTGLMVATGFNVEKRVVQINIDNHLAGRRALDAAYIGDLSNDAMPAIFERFASLDEKTQKAIGEQWKYYEYGTQHRYDALTNRMEKKDWREFTFAAFLAQQAYTKYGMNVALQALNTKEEVPATNSDDGDAQTH